MKSEERHRLQETELEKLGRHAQDFWESFLKDYAKIAVIGIGVACVLAGILLWWWSSSYANEAERWNEVLAASFDSDPAKSIEQLALTADKYPSHPAGQWAGLMEAERALSAGIQTARTNRKTSISELVQAREAYVSLADSKSELIQERRLFGLARCLETLAGVDVREEKGAENVKGVDDAITAYGQFLERYPESIFATLAENRIKALKTPGAQDFYAWYRDQDPNPEDFKTPEDTGLPAGHPPIGTGPSFPTGPPSTEESVVQELESIVKRAKEKANQERAPDFPTTNEPPKGPALIPPNTDDKKPEEPAPPKTEEKKPDEPAKAETQDKKPTE
jgi:hypothetical protein